MDTAVAVKKIIKLLPYEERYGLCDQINRCSISIPSNIAEGHARNSNKEFYHFLSIARGSIAELQTQLLLCVRFEYMEESMISKAYDDLTEIDKMVCSLMSKLKSPKPTTDIRSLISDF